MTATELTILRFFRRFQVGPTEMLFLNSADCKVGASSFTPAMRRLIEKGIIVKERPEQAYSLTHEGYRLTRTVKEAPVVKPRGKRKARNA
jgi:predicted transcriptional regulator